jgi:hypothetical protein
VLHHSALVHFLELVENDVGNVRVEVVQIEVHLVVHQLTVKADDEISGLVAKGVAFGKDPVHHQFEDGPQAMTGIAEWPGQLVQDHEFALEPQS